MFKNPMIIISLCWISGILLDVYFPLSFGLNLSLILFFFCTYFFLNKIHFLKFTIHYSLLLILLFSAKFLTHLSNPFHHDKHYSKVYLSGDVIKGEVENFKKTKSSYYKCEVNVLALLRNKKQISANGKVLLFVKKQKWKFSKPVILFQCDLSTIKNKNNPGEFNAASFWENKGIKQVGFIEENNIKEIGSSTKGLFDYFSDLQVYFSSIIDRFLSGNEASVAKALILGDRSSLDSEITSKFGNTGAMHVLAVSGLHVGILMEILLLFLGFFKRFITKNQAIVITLILVWCYSFLTGFSPSIVRSVLMFSIITCGTLFSKNSQNFNSLALACLIILIWKPAFLFDIGFQLSFLAMVGIFLFYQDLSVLLTFKNKIVQKIWEGTMVGIAAQLLTVPFTLYYFHQFPNYFILSNIGLMFSSFWVLALGIALFSSFYIPILSKIVAFGLWINLVIMLFVISWIDSLPGAVANGFHLSMFQVVLIFILLFLFYFSFQKRNIKLVLLSLTCAFLTVVSIVFIRWQKMYENHICFFNENQVAFSIKIKQNAYIFYNKEQYKNKIEFLAENYRKTNGVTLFYVPLQNIKMTKLTNSNNNIYISRVKGGYHILINTIDYFIATTNISNFKIKNTVYASWIKNSNNSLKDGAKIIIFS